MNAVARTRSDIGVYLLADVPDAVLERLRSSYMLHDGRSLACSNGRLAAIADTIRAVVTNRLHGFDGAMFRALRNVEIVSVWGTGTYALDLEAAKAAGVAVACTTDDGTDRVVAELALGLMLAVSRKIVSADRFVRAGRWPSDPVPWGLSLGGKVCGVVGLGYVGRQVARLASAIGMTVVYHARRARPEVPYEYIESLRELARRADVLVVAVTSVTGENRGLVGAEVLAAMNRQAILVNISGGAGGVVDEDALIDALRAGRLAGAGLDVFEHEPNIRSGLWTLDNVVLTPHIGWRTQELLHARNRLVVDNIEAHLTGRPLRGRLV